MTIDGISIDELTDLPEITEHAKERWETRTPDSAKSIAHAWYYGENVDILAHRLRDRHGHEAERARLYHALTAGGVEYTVIIICRSGKFITVLEMDAAGGYHRGGKKTEVYLKQERDKNIIREEEFANHEKAGDS